MTNLKILVVDDEKEFRECMVHRLKVITGGPPHTAASYAEALEKMSQNTYDVLLTDTNLGAESGIELIKMVKKLHPNVQIYSLFSGLFGSSLSKKDVEALGVAGVMTKFEISECLLPELRALATRTNY
jgi:CheY-like chemotaxis protein